MKGRTFLGLVPDSTDSILVSASLRPLDDSAESMAELNVVPSMSIYVTSVSKEGRKLERFFFLFTGTFDTHCLETAHLGDTMLSSGNSSLACKVPSLKSRLDRT